MKSKKVTMLAAALVVAVVAFAAVGYATTYKATTSNTNNSVTATYVEMKQYGDSAFAGATFIDGIYYNTTTAAGNAISYVVTGESIVVDQQSSTTAFLISNGGLVLNVDGTNDSQTYTMTIKANKALTAGYTFYFGLKTGTWANDEFTPANPEAYKWSAGVTGASATTGWTITGVPEGTFQVVVAAVGTANSQPTDITAIQFDFEVSATV